MKAVVVSKAAAFGPLEAVCADLPPEYHARPGAWLWLRVPFRGGVRQEPNPKMGNYTKKGFNICFLF